MDSGVTAAGQVRVTGHVHGRTVEAWSTIGVEQLLQVIKQIPQGA